LTVIHWDAVRWWHHSFPPEGTHREGVVNADAFLLPSGVVTS